MARPRPQSKPGKARRRRRRGLLALLLLLAALLLPVVLTRSALVKAVILPRIGSRLGAEVSATRLVIEPDARIVATGVEIRLPGLDGRAGQLLTAKRVEIASSWGALLSGSGAFREMVLTQPLVRVSRDTRSGSINLGELRVPASDGRPLTAAPRIIVREGTIELGEHTGTDYALLRTLRVEGSTRPTAAAEGAGYELAFTEGAVSDPQGRGLGLTGRVSPEGITLTLSGLELGQWQPEHIPGAFRGVFELMRIEGGIPSASMSVAADGTARGRVTLDGVSLNLPFDAEGHPADPADPADLVRLRDVTGWVDVTDAGAVASLKGMLGDLPSTVLLRYGGLRDDSGFRCDISTKGFALRSDPEILPLVPAIVVKRLNEFSNPTATVDAVVAVERGAPTASGPGEIRVFGELTFRDGTAAFRDFPYTFAQLTGLARFDEEKIEIVRVDGVAETGARLHAEGTIAPPLPGAGVDLRIVVEGVPIDDALLDALGEQRRGIVEALCSREQDQRLRQRGLVHDPGAEGAGTPFALGGVASVEIHVQRAVGEEAEYTEQIRVRLPVVGLVPEPFPLPIVAKDLEIEIVEREARLVAGTFAGLSGGRAEIEATVDLNQPDERGVRLTIRAEDVPTDELLLAALPRGLDETAGPRSPSAVVRRLGIAGVVDCSAVIGPRAGGDLGYDIEVGFDGISASPAHDPGLASGALDLQGVEGRLRVSERELGLAVTSRARARGSEVAPGGTPAAPDSGSLAIDARMQLEGEGRPFTLEVDADLSDVAVALEDLVSVIAPEMAGRLAEVRRQRRPAGGVRLLAHAAGDAAGDGEVSRLDIEVYGCEGLAFDAEPGRMMVTSGAGQMGFSALSPETAVFDGWAAEVMLDGGVAGGVELSGRAPVGRAWGEGDELRLGARGAVLESPLVRRAAMGGLPAKVGAAMEASAIEGVIDADLLVRGGGGSESPRVTGTIRPRRCELTIAGQRVSMASMRGEIVLDETGGTFDDCRAEGRGWWAEVAGAWVGAGGGSVLLDCAVRGASESGLVPEVRALLPAGLRGALEAVSIDADGPIAAEGVSFRTSLGEGEGSAYTASGRVVFAGVSADVGVKVTGATGYLDFEGKNEPGAALGNFGIGVIVDSAQAAGIHLRDGMLRVTTDPFGGTVLVPVILADAYGGRASGSAVVRAAGDGRSTYDAEFRLSGVPLGELLADWEHAAGIERAAASDAAAPARPSAESRGMVDAGLTLTGVAGPAGTRRGRGMILVGGGEHTEVLRLPLLLPLIEVSNLQVPGNDPLDFGEAVFYLDGDRVVFERVGVFARSVEIFGYGQMTLPGLDLDLRFNSRAAEAERLPMISGLVERFRDELITTRVRGTAKDPEVSAEQFTGTRRLLAGVTGREPSPEERRMQQIERLSRESAHREWRLPRRGGSSSSPGR